MPDGFERALRAGSAQFAANTRLDAPSEIRTRGERRARRQAVAAVAAVLAVAGGAVTAAAATRDPDNPPPLPAVTVAPSTGATPPPASGTPSPPPSASRPGSTGAGTPAAPRSGGGPAAETSGSATPAPGVAQCPASAIDGAVVTRGTGQGGNALTTVTVTFEGRTACTLSGYPTLVGTDPASGARVTVPVEHGTYFDADYKKYGAVVRPGQRVSFDIGTTSVPADGTAPSGYTDIAILAPHHVEVPISGNTPDTSTTDYDVGRWYLAE